MEDTELIRATRQGDLTAFNDLVLKYQDQIFNHAYRLLGNQDIAEDITQDAFILAFRKIYQYRDGSFRAWLLKIVTNLCYSEMRTWKRSSLLALEPINQKDETNESPRWMKDPNPGPEEIVETSDLHNKLEYAMNMLPSIYRTAISLIDLQELHYKEAASIIGISMGTVKSRLARGRMQLRRILMDIDPQYVSKADFANRPEAALLSCQSE